MSLPSSPASPPAVDAAPVALESGLPVEAHLRPLPSRPVRMMLMGVGGIVGGLTGVGLLAVIFRGHPFLQFAATLGLVAVAGSYFLRRTYGTLRLMNEEVAKAQSLINEWKLDDAAKTAEDVSKLLHKRKMPPYHGYALLQLVRVEILRGNFERAITIGLAVDQAANLKRIVAEAYEQNTFLIAFTYILKGDLDEGERWLKLAHERQTLRNIVHGDAVEAFLATRKGDLALATDHVDLNRRRLDAGLPLDMSRATRVLRAFIESRRSGDDAATTLLAAVMPVEQSEFAYLGRSWPEMFAFLKGHGLV